MGHSDPSVVLVGIYRPWDGVGDTIKGIFNCNTYSINGFWYRCVKMSTKFKYYNHYESNFYYYKLAYCITAYCISYYALNLIRIIIHSQYLHRNVCNTGVIKCSFLTPPARSQRTRQRNKLIPKATCCGLKYTWQRAQTSIVSKVSQLTAKKTD